MDRIIAGATEAVGKGKRVNKVALLLIILYVQLPYRMSDETAEGLIEGDYKDKVLLI